MSAGVVNLPGVDTSVPGPQHQDHNTCFAVTMRGQELRDLDAAQWDALVENAVEPNPFFSRASVLAGIDALGDAEGLEAVAFRRNRDGKLIGLAPFKRERFGRLVRLSDARSALNLYQVGGSPLIDKDHQDTVIASALRLLDVQKSMASCWAFPHVDLDGPFARLLRRHAAGRGLAVRGVETYKRPILTRHPDGLAAHVETVIGRKRARDVQRNIRRLGEFGSVRFERATDAVKVAQRVEQFLAIEHAGWKGKKGTSFAANPDHARYARLAYGQSAIVDSLLLDEKPIALSINLGAGTTLFTPKCAFDETYRKYGPGLILEYMVIEAFYGETSFEAMNAATTVDGHVISNFWNGECAMGTIIVGPDGWRTNLLAWIEEAENGTRRWAKSLIRRYRRPAS